MLRKLAVALALVAAANLTGAVAASAATPASGHVLSIPPRCC